MNLQLSQKAVNSGLGGLLRTCHELLCSGLLFAALVLRDARNS